MTVKRALLVGLNYKGTPNELRGCENDIMAMNEVITTKFGFTDNTQKRVITGPSGTTKNIMDRLKWLVDGLKPGDHAFFHYSGHGSQLPDTDYDLNEEPDGLDEILCVDSSSHIYTSEGLLSAKELYNKLNYGKQIKAIVNSNEYIISNWAKTKKDKAVEITLTNGKHLRVGEEHPIGVFNSGKLDFVNAKDIKVNDSVVSHYDDSEFTNNSLDMKWYIIGLFIGDGFFMSGKTIRFAIRTYIEEWKQTLLVAQESIEDFSYSIKTNKRGDTIICISSQTIIEELKEMGFIPYKRKVVRSKHVMFPNDKRQLASLLSGIFDADGSSSEKIITLTLEDEELISLVNTALQKFGISSSIYNKKTYHNLQINNTMSDKFIERIGFQFSEKNERVCQSQMMNGAGIFGTLNISEFFDFMESWGFPKSECVMAIGNKGRSLARIKSGIGTEKNIISIKEWIDRKIDIVNEYSSSNVFTQEMRKCVGAVGSSITENVGTNEFTFYKRLENGNFSDIKKFLVLFLAELEKWKNKLSWIDNNTKVLGVSKVELVEGDFDMYDFTVDGIHQFECNGILVHNCPVDLDWRTKVIKDDDFRRIFANVPAGVRLTVLLDACHSGTGLRDMEMPLEIRDAINGPVRNRVIPMPVDIANRAFGLELPVKPRGLALDPQSEQKGLLISGCSSNQTSADAWIQQERKYMGACTATLISVLRARDFKVSNRDLINDLRRNLTSSGYEQTPELSGEAEMFDLNFLM